MNPKDIFHTKEKKYQTYWNDHELKYSGKEEIEDRIKTLAASYVPEWHFDPANPDIGGTIAKIFAGQMDGNLNRYYQVIDKYHEEFINMMGMSLSSAKPAYCVVALSLAANTIPGLQLHKGTKFLTGSEEEEQLIFEAQHNLYITNSELSSMFMTEQKTGKIVPIRGEFSSASYLPEEETEGASESEEAEETDKNAFPVPLFSSNKEGIEQHVLLFYHSSAFDVENDLIYIRLEGNQKLIRKIQEGSIILYYYSEEGVLPVEQLQFLEDGYTLAIEKKVKNKKITLKDQKEYSLFFLKAKEAIRENYEIDGIGISSKGSPVQAEGISNAVTDLNQESFDLFSDTLSLYQECYIGHNGYFSKAGANISIKFLVSFLENRISGVQLAEEENLKVIKRKPQNTFVEVFSEVVPEEISVEYFNGIGWKKIPAEVSYSGLFSEKKEGEYEISFLCPRDWEETQAGAYRGRCIRIQLLKATNCYLRPAIHYYPRIRNLRISYSYKDHFVEPEFVEAICGTDKKNYTSKLKAKKAFSAFSPGEYEKDGFYLGFEEKIESGPVSFFFKLEKELMVPAFGCKYEYSSIKGFKQMKVIDQTNHMSRSGTVLFMPPADMAPITLEGKSCYWIRISPTYYEERYDENYGPVIEDILVNAVQVANIETREEEEFYLDETHPGLSVSLGTDNILDVELWVNEMGQMSRHQMMELQRTAPEKVRIEYDRMGDILSFYVRWQESQVLEHETEKRSYALDRLNGTLHFGDGIHTGLPKVLDDTAFKVRIRCCNGQRGNIDEGTITESMENLMFVNQITNPIRGYGGSNMETIEKVMKRGSNLLRNRGRMVSVRDYTEEILNYSDGIDKVKCIVGTTLKLEEDDKAVNFVILLKEFKNQAGSFQSISSKIKERLLDSCELTVLGKNLHIVEPIFVEISVDIWAETVQTDQGFEIQNTLQECLMNYLNPVRNEKKSGWEIGTLPQKNQIAMELNVLRKDALIRKMAVTASYIDHRGEHIVDLDELKVNPFMICCNGKHRVHVMYT